MSTDDKPDCTDDRYVTPGDFVPSGDTESPRVGTARELGYLWQQIAKIAGAPSWEFESFDAMHRKHVSATDLGRVGCLLNPPGVMFLLMRDERRLPRAHSLDMTHAEANHLARQETIDKLRELDPKVLQAMSTELTQAASAIGKQKPDKGAAILLVAQLVYLIAQEAEESR